LRFSGSAHTEATTEAAAGRRLNSLAGVVRLALWTGALAGVVQLVGLAIRKWGFGEFLFASSDVWWTTPVTTMVVFTIVAVTMSILAKWSDRHLWSWLVGVFAFLAALSFLYLFPQIHRLAALVLAAGIGFQGFRIVVRRPAAFERLTRRTTPLLIVLVLLSATIIRGVQ